MSSANITLSPRRSKGVINRNLYGHFAEHLGRCVYEGIFVGKDSPIPNINGMRTDVVEALRRLQVPLVRWPGGCFADEYHWKDGIGTPEERTRMVNTNWGGVVEDNSFGTHEFLELCRQVGCEPYINANVGSGTVQEMAEWVEYLNSQGDSTTVRKRWQNGQRDPFGVRFWGVGNESWGCGGNMRPEFYADEYRRYQTYCRTYGQHKLYRIACGPNTDDYTWTETVMRNAASYMEGLTLHYYTVPKVWEDKGAATVCDEPLYYQTLLKANRMEELIHNHLEIMDRYDPTHRVALLVDEWGVWHNVEPGTNPGYLYQQNTIRDALVAALTLNVFNHHCDRVAMANIAQMVNVLQAIVLTEGDQMVLTPTYHVFDLYRPHMDATEVDCFIDCATLANGMAQVSGSASVKENALTVTLANLSCTDEATVQFRLADFVPTRATGRILTGHYNDYNDFDHPSTVAPCAYDDAVITEYGVSVVLPPCAILALTLHRNAS